jgi:hypothetical protein
VAVVDVPFLLGGLVTPGLLKGKLEEKGFREVFVSEDKSPSFPLSSEGDYYVGVSWKNAPQVFDVPSAVIEHGRVA